MTLVGSERAFALIIPSNGNAAMAKLVPKRLPHLTVL